MKNLILHIEQIKAKDLSFDFEEEPGAFPVLAELVQKQECEFLAPLKVSTRTFRIMELFEVEGHFQTKVRLTCSRCLKKFERLLASEFALTYTREAPGVTTQSTEQEVELRVEEIGLMYFRGEEIDLRDGIQEQVVMALPLKPLCDVKCQGLCPSCGADRNQGDCGCERKSGANPFLVLKDLKLNKKKQR
jgi:uncharacterized protein